MDGHRIKLQIWDTAGEERFRSITSSFYRGAHGVVIVFDLTRPETLKNVPKWLAEVEKHIRLPVSQLMVGNKLDSPKRVVTTEEAFSVANSFGKCSYSKTKITYTFVCADITYLETSAKTFTNVEQMFFKMVIEMKNRQDHTKTSTCLLESVSPIKLGEGIAVDVNEPTGCCNL